MVVVVVVVVDVRPTTSHLRCSVAEFDPKEMKFAPQTYTSRSVVVKLIQIDHRYIPFGCKVVRNCLETFYHAIACCCLFVRAYRNGSRVVSRLGHVCASFQAVPLGETLGRPIATSTSPILTIFVSFDPPSQY